jgi:hypothetical protein
MADTVTDVVIFNGARHLVVRLTNVSDGTGESNVTKVDATSGANGVIVQGQTIAPGTNLKVTKVDYNVAGMQLRMQWKGSSNQDFLVLGPGADHLDFTDIGGIQCPPSSGVGSLAGSTGSIAFTTAGQTSVAGNSGYSVVLHMTKGVPQS